MRKPINVGIYYAAAILAILYCSKYYKTGPCTPNLDILSFLLLLPLSFALLAQSFLRIVTRKQERKIPFFIHIVGVATMLFLFLK